MVLILIPQKALRNYLKDHKNWKYDSMDKRHYYDKYPEYKIFMVEDGQPDDAQHILRDFEKYFTDPSLLHINENSLRRETYILKYGDTCFDDITCVLIAGLDNNRRFIPYPTFDDETNTYYIKKNYELDMCRIIQNVYYPSKGYQGTLCINDYTPDCTIMRFTKFELRDAM